MNIKQLQRKRAELDKQIAVLEAANRAAHHNAVLNSHGVKIVCRRCAGTAEVSRGGADIISDPPEHWPCDLCGGEGFLWAIKWERKQNYGKLLEHDERQED